MAASLLPILVAGAGNMGGAIVAGWRLTGAVDARDLILRDPVPGPEALAAAEAGARLNPPDTALLSARMVLLAVKPAIWRAAAAEISPRLHPDAVVVSVAAGVEERDLAEAFGGRPIVRVMPTTAVAIGRGAVAIHSTDPALGTAVRKLFEPLGAVTELANEKLMHVVTGASGSGPAYLYAFIEALEAAAIANGLDPEGARQPGQSQPDRRRRLTRQERARIRPSFGCGSLRPAAPPKRPSRC